MKTCLSRALVKVGLLSGGSRHSLVLRKKACLAQGEHALLVDSRYSLACERPSAWPQLFQCYFVRYNALRLYRYNATLYGRNPKVHVRTVQLGGGLRAEVKLS